MPVHENLPPLPSHHSSIPGYYARNTRRNINTGAKLKMEEFPNLVTILEYEFGKGDDIKRGGGGLESHSKLHNILYRAADNKTKMKNTQEALLPVAPNDFSISLSACLKVIPQFCIAHFYCAHLITYNFIHYTYRLKKYHFMTILCYFKTSLFTFVQKITLKSMFSKKAYKSVARVSVSVVYL